MDALRVQFARNAGFQLFAKIARRCRHSSFALAAFVFAFFIVDGAAQSIVTVEPNVRIGGGAETSVAINPINPFNWLVSYNWGIAFSLDGGLTWTATSPLLPVDPNVGFDSNGVGYWQGMITSDPRSVQVARSFDGGQMWTPSLVYAPTPGTGNPDQPFMTIDTQPTSRFLNNVYVILSDYPATPQPGRIGFSLMFGRSTDGGRIFTPPIDISDSASGEQEHSSHIATGPNGEIYVAWSDNSGRLLLDRSFDGGLTWGTDQVIRQTPTPINSFPVTDDVRGNPTLAVDLGDGPFRGTIYVSGIDKNGPGGAAADAWVIHSSDGGNTWSHSVLLSDGPGGAYKWYFQPRIAVAPNGRLDAAWYDTRLNVSSDTNDVTYDVFYTYSTNRGQSFAPNVRVSDVSARKLTNCPNQGECGDRRLYEYLGLASEDHRAVVAWTDFPPGYSGATIAQINVTGGATTLTASPATVARGSAITAAWSGISSPTPRDWIGLYSPGAANSAALEYVYVSCTRTPGNAAASGSCNIVVPSFVAPGTYQLRLFANDGYTSLATSNSFTVTGGVTLTASPATVARGSAITAAWSGISSPTPRDWIGLYTPGAANSAALEYVYVSCTRTPGNAAASGSCNIVVPSFVAPGTYQLRLFANDGYTSLATSNSFTVTGGATLTASPATVARGSAITAAWSGISSPTPRDWIGLYTPGSANSAAIEYVYVSCTRTPGNAAASGSCNIVVPSFVAPGAYQLRLFANDGYTSLATSNSFTVTGGVTLTASPATVARGSAITAAWSGISSPTPRDWIGLYTPGSANSAALEYVYVSCTRTPGNAAASGSCNIVVPSFVAPGTYQLRLFANDGYTSLATSNSFTVTGGVTLTASPATVARGSAITAAWSGISSPTPRDWIGLYTPGAANSAALEYVYVSCTRTPGNAAASGSCNIVVPSFVAPGTYQLRLFANDGYTSLATSNSFTVTGGVTLTASPATVARGSAITAAWSGISSPTPRDWIGLYSPGAANSAALEYVYVSCTRTPGNAAASGSCNIVVPSFVAPGTYQLRLFANDGYTSLATSNSFTVTDGVTLTASLATVARGSVITGIDSAGCGFDSIQSGRRERKEWRC